MLKLKIAHHMVYNVGSKGAIEVYSMVIRQLAEKNDCLLAGIYAAEGCADWLIHPDTVHANNLGHRIIGHRVFEVIAQNCSGVAAKVLADLEKDRVWYTERLKILGLPLTQGGK